MCVTEALSQDKMKKKKYLVCTKRTQNELLSGLYKLSFMLRFI